MWPIASPEVFDFRQKRIRDLEWGSIADDLKKYSSGNFLDVGCGAGHALSKAKSLNFSVWGVDPQPGGFSVSASFDVNNQIIEAVAEKLPFESAKFHVVYSSHALEHFQDRDQGLREMVRVVRPDGIVVIAVPTGTMALINFVSKLIFKTHIQIGWFLFRERSLTSLKHIFLPPAHGSSKKSVLSEIQEFSIKRWNKIISKYINIEKIVLPGLYPFPDFPQFFPFFKSSKFSSSVIFIGKRRV